ncbi:MAG TPA: VOC family protein [Porticoccaceae bacterium]|jgi:catechol 2,3-dioxygenase-like lactoylglutathione lyase family enzyme|nr:VOC family protein [Porticoccaceae bacterium]
MLRITRLNHSAINTRDQLDAMRRFYLEVLGAPTVERDIPARFADRIPGFWMQFPNGQVHVIQCDPAQAGEPLPGMSCRHANPMGPHTAFYVADIEAAARHLSENGIDFDRFDRFIFTTDPSGNTVEFQQDPEIG